MNTKIQITECPRDAMQGLSNFIPTASKIEYLNQLLDVGFDRLDCGSFVSAKAIPQMADTKEVLAGLKSSNTELLVIIANERGAQDALDVERVRYLGYPFSISETFQQRNTNTSIEGSFERVKSIHQLTKHTNKELLVYISMAFGNPYGDAWNPELVGYWIEQLHQLGINEFALADTVGTASEDSISGLYHLIQKRFSHLNIGLHLHSTPEATPSKIKVALESGCRAFDVAIKGYGGCPMASNTLTGNSATEVFLNQLDQLGYTSNVNPEAFEKAFLGAGRIF